MIPDFAQSLYDRFEREGIPLLLAGGWAVCHHGYSRYTNDIDWICSRNNEARALEVMTSLGFEIAFEAMATQAFADFRGSHLIDGAGHWVQQEQPEAVTAHLLGFLRGT